jgi:hypothetical protein
VPEEIVVTKPASHSPEPTAETEPSEAQISDVADSENRPHGGHLERAAMRYLWYHPTGDVRDFVKWYQSGQSKLT